MKKIVEFLDGKKTFIGAIIIFIAGGFKALGKLDDNTYTALLTLGGAISVYGLRVALGKVLERKR